MGEYWHLSVGRRELMTGKNYVPDPLMLVFDDSARIFDRDRYSALEAEWESEDDLLVNSATSLRRLYVYEASAEALKRRLSLQGFGVQAIRKHAIRYLQNELGDDDRYVPDDWVAFEEKYSDAEKLLEALLTWRFRGPHTTPRAKLSREDAFLDSYWSEIVESFDDPRFVLALGLQKTRAATKVVLDLSNLLLGGWLQPDEVPHETARFRVANEVASSGPIIVVTEGRTDAHFIRRSIALAAPELVDAFAFLDFEGNSAPGGIDRVVALVRGMAAAQVMNRVIAVLDNDTAGRGGLNQLERSGLPARMTATTLPDVTYARRYPTVGPTGAHVGDVNGRAVAIEMMFGQDVMRDPLTGELPAIRWTGYNQALADYQGSLELKGPVQERIHKATDVESIADLEPEIADGCRRLVSMLISSAAEATPALASDFSPLLWHRVRE